MTEAAEILSAWHSAPGAARCRLVEARLRWDLGGGARPPRVGASTRARAAADVAAQRADLRGWLRLESSWVVPLLAASLPEAMAPVDDLLLDLGPTSVPILIAALAEPRSRLRAIQLLGELGDSRARRPLAVWVRRGEPRVRAAAAGALGRLPGAPAPNLHVRLFGSFVVDRDGERIDEGSWRTRKVKALVKLLLHGDAGVHRDQLIEWLWPERDPRAGAVNLKTAVKLARHALEPLAEGVASHFLRWEGGVLRLHRGGVWVDVAEYARILDESRAHRTAGRLDEAIAALERAVTLYRGDLLDPDDRYEEWAADARERWRAVQFGVITDLSHLYAARGDYDRASEVMQKALALDAAQEVVYRDLMRYALCRGRRDEAIALYQRCAQVLRKELGVEPQPATARVLEEAPISI